MRSDDTDALPRVTAGLLGRAESMCARRLDREHEGARGNRRADIRFRVANQLIDDARLNHVDLAHPRLEHFRPASDLLAEQQHVYRLAARWYVELFGDRAVRSIDTEFETVVESLGVRLVGPVGLPVEDASGDRELRVLRLGRGPVATDLLGATEIRFAILRLRVWAGGAPLRLVVADLIRGELASEVVDIDVALAGFDPWLAERVERIRSRGASRRPRAGLECGWCPFVAGCGAHPRR